MTSPDLSRFLLEEIHRKSFPGAQYVVLENGATIAEGAHGNAVVTPEAIPAALDTIYDLASLTKPLVTALLFVILGERRIIDLNAPASSFLSELDTDDKRGITITELLSHTSGLPRWRPLYAQAADPAGVLSEISRLPLERSPAGTRPVIYSDLNYIVAGGIIEKITGDRLDQVAGREIFNPLGLSDTIFNPPPSLKPRIAATEKGRRYEKNAAEGYEPGKHGLANANDTDAVIWGEVHDGNAAFLGGIAGHAGLFSTAREVARLATAFLPESRLLDRESLGLFTRNLSPSPDSSHEHRSVGWLLASTPDCAAAPSFPTTAFGHNGFTGTSVWIDPERSKVYVLLTNRVHPIVQETDMKTIRRRFNALAAEVTR